MTHERFAVRQRLLAGMMAGSVLVLSACESTSGTDQEPTEAISQTVVAPEQSTSNTISSLGAIATETTTQTSTAIISPSTTSSEASAPTPAATPDTSSRATSSSLAMHSSSSSTRETTSSNDDSCIANIKVFPGSRLKSSNVDDIDKQIQALKVSYDAGAKITARNVINALALIGNAYADPNYADALMADNRLLAGGKPPLSAQALLQEQHSGHDCLTIDQVKQVNALYDQLVTSYGKMIGSQTSAATKLAYDKLKVGWETFQEKFKAFLHDS